MYNFSVLKYLCGSRNVILISSIYTHTRQGLNKVCIHCGIKRKIGDLTQSYDETPYINRKFENQRTTHKRHQKLRFHNYCGPT